MRSVVLGLVLASSAASADPEPIIGGTKATNGQFPTVVAVSLGGGLCTGTLITPEWVLTAGHCVTPSLICGSCTQQQLTANTTVIFDNVSPFTTGGGKQIGALETIPDPMYNVNTGLDHDVGLIHLKTAVTDRTPVPLNRTAKDAAFPIHLQMIGYGVNTSGGQNAGVEYFLDDKVTESCAGVGDPGALDTNLLCWQQGGSTVSGKCEGDSGGPSFAVINNKKMQVGITSVGWSSSSNQTACDGWGADTRVDHVIGWLDSKIGDALKCAADNYCMAGCANDPDCPTCTKDEDCGADKICDMGHCGPAPFTPMGPGTTCVKDTDCASGMCASVGTDKKCSENSVTTDNKCPSGFDCLPTGGPNNAGACWPGANDGGDSSCSASGSGSGATLFLIGLAALFVRRRR